MTQDQITITMVDPNFALIEGTVDGRHIRKMGGRKDINWYTRQTVVNSKGQPVPVTVK